MIRLILALLLSLSLAAHAGVKTAGVGHFQIPTAPAAGTSVTSGAANTYTTTYVQLIASTSAALYITGVHLEAAAASAATYKSVQLATGGAGSETIIGQYLVPLTTASTSALGFRPIYPPIPVANATRIAAKVADSVGSQAVLVTLEVLAQTNYIDDGVAVGTVTTVTNQLTAAQVATGVWQDATSGDFTTASSIGKTLYIANVAPGGSGGLIISGTNTGTTTLGALTITGATTHTGNVVLSDGLTISAPSTGNRAGLDIAGNGTGAALKLVAGATGVGMSVAGGGTSGDGIKVTTTSGHGVNLAPVGTSMHGLLATGGNGGTSDGIKAVAGTGGVDMRAAITGNVTGNVSGSVGSVTGLTASNLDTTVSSRMATYTQPTGFLAATFPSGTVANTTNITAGTIATVTTVTNQLTAAAIATGVWQDATAGDFTAASSIGKSVMNGVALGTGLTVNDLTTKTGFSLAASQHVIVDSGTVTTLTNLPSIPANWLTATGINAGALNGKGDWLLSSSYTAPTNLTAAQIATGVWQDTTAGDFTTALSVGKSVMNGVSLGTGLTIASVSGAVGSVTGAVGSVTGLTASNLDTTVSSRMATYTQPTGFLAATFPGTVASPTNITAATGITVATNSDKTGYALTAGYDPAKTASQAGDAMTLTAAYDSAKTAAPASTALSTATWTSGRASNLDNLNAAVTTRMATFSLPTNFSSLAVTVGGAVTAGTVSDKTGYALTSAYDPAKTAAQAGDSMAINSTGINSIWNESLSGHTTAGTAGKALSDASSGADPWAITLPGAYGASSAGYIVGTYLNATISSRLPTSSYTAPDNSSITAIKGKTDSLTFTVPNSLDVNAHHVNDVRLSGNGQDATPWGPAP